MRYKELFLKSFIALLIFLDPSTIDKAFCQALLINTEVLMQNKLDLDKKLVKSHVNELIKSADEILMLPNPTVIKKSSQLNKGSINDYYSLATYWWPDPTKEDGLPYIAKDGIPNPERLLITDHSELKTLCSSVKLLSLSYFFTNNQKYIVKVEELLFTWFINEKTKMNPNLNYSQAIPGRTDGRVEGLIDTRCLVELIDALTLLDQSGVIDMEIKDGLTFWLNQFLDWMVNSDIGKKGFNLKNNIGTAYYMQLLSYANFVGGEKKIKILKLVEPKILKLLNEQFKLNGEQPLEIRRINDLSYSISNLVYWFNIANLIEINGVDLWSTGQLEKGYFYINHYSKNSKQSLDSRKSLKRLLYELEAVLNDKNGGSDLLIPLPKPGVNSFEVLTLLPIVENGM